MRVDLCIIAKNEDKTIERCIASVKHLVHRIIVVDTGSTDTTVEVAKTNGAEIFHFEWKDNFAAARNFTLQKSNADWIIFLDADEYFAPIEKEIFNKCLKKASQGKCDVVLADLINIEDSTGELKSTTQLARVLNNKHSLQYRGAVHEQLMHPKRQLHGYASKEIKVFHTGYSANTIAEKKKGERNLAILFAEAKKCSDSGNIHFYLVESLKLEGRFEEALFHSYEVERCNNSTLVGTLEKTLYHRLDCMIRLKKEHEAIIAAYEDAIVRHSSFPDYDRVMGEYYACRNDVPKAIIHYELVLQKASSFQSGVESWVITRIDEIYMILSKLYMLQGDKQMAVNRLVPLIKVDKYNYEALYLLMNLLKESETSAVIYQFLMQLYDEKSIKDKMYLLKVVEQVNMMPLYRKIAALLTEEEQGYLDNTTF